MPTLLDPADLRAFARRQWGLLDDADREARASASPADRWRLANALYASARATNPGWPTDADRLEDLAHHSRMRRLLDKADRVGR